METREWQMLSLMCTFNLALSTENTSRSELGSLNPNSITWSNESAQLNSNGLRRANIDADEFADKI